MEPLNLICFDCKHFRPIRGGCDAFPDEIPDEILQTNEHATPLPKQGNDIVFEPGPNEGNQKP